MIASGDEHHIGTGSYRLTLAKSPGAFVVPAGDDGGPLTNGAIHTGTIDQGDLDQWSFQANAGDSLKLAMRIVTNSGNFGTWVRLRAPDGRELESKQSVNPPQINLVAPQTGTYTVVIASSDVNRIGTGTYELVLTKPPGALAR